MCPVPTNRKATIMPKKYLIYIHNNERFDQLNERGQKSNLINDLLDQHWTMQDLAEQAKKSPNGVAVPGAPNVRLAVVAKPKIIAKPEDIKPAIKNIGSELDTCPHGYAKGMCKKVACNKKFAAVESA